MTLLTPRSRLWPELARAAAKNLAADAWVAEVLTDPPELSESHLDRMLAAKEQRYSDDQPRDDHGRWTAGGLAKPDDYNPTAFFPDDRADEPSVQAWAATVSRVYNPDERGPGMTALNHYKGGSYYAINETLRDPSYDPNAKGSHDSPDHLTRQQAEGDARMLSAMIADQQPTSQDTVLYRGLSPSHEPAESGIPRYDAMAPGTTFTEPGFTSMTTNPEFAKTWEHGGNLSDVRPSYATGTQTGSQLLEVHAPAGTQGLYVPVATAARYDPEEEVIGPPGMVFQVREQLADRTVVNVIPRPETRAYIGWAVMADGTLTEIRYSDDQPRDDHGRWSSGGSDESSVVAIGERGVTSTLSEKAYGELQQAVDAAVARDPRLEGKLTVKMASSMPSISGVTNDTYAAAVYPGVFGATNSRTGETVINDVEYEPKLEDIFGVMQERGDYASPASASGPYGAMTHEIGHVEFGLAGYPTTEDARELLSDYSFKPSDYSFKPSVLAPLGMYASSSPAEAAAEMYAQSHTPGYSLKEIDPELDSRATSMMNDIGVK